MLHPPGYNVRKTPFSSKGRTESKAENDRRGPPPSASSHLGINPSRHPDFNQFCLESRSHQPDSIPGRVPCPWSGCSSNFKPERRQDLRSHILPWHLPYSLFCPTPSCNWRGACVEQFKTHCRTTHPGHEPEPCQIYNTVLILDYIDEGTPVEQAERFARRFVAERAVELKKVEEWEDLCGRRASTGWCRC
jgi:hypothetical protein